MVEPFAGPVAWLWQFQPPHPRVPLWKGLDNGRAKGSYLLLGSGGEKINYYSQHFFFSFIHLFTAMAPKTKDLHPPALPRWSPLLSLLSFIIGTCFWLVVVCKFIDRRPPKVTVYFLFDFILHQICCLQRLDAALPYVQPPCTSSPTSLLPQPPTPSWLLCVTNKRRPPKADAPFSSLFFDVVYFGVPNGNQPARQAITKHWAPDLDP